MKTCNRFARLTWDLAVQPWPPVFGSSIASWNLMRPKHFVCYAGENDLGDGRTAEEVYLFFRQFQACLQKRFPGVPLTYISIKPSVSRWNLEKQVRYANELIKAEIEKATRQPVFPQYVRSHVERQWPAGKRIV